MRIRLFALILVCLATARPQAPKRSLPPLSEIREIKATGCVRKAAVGRCMLLVSLDGESTYSFVVAPKPELGAIITIQGKTHKGAAVCKQGIEIDVTDWQPDGSKCVD